MKVKQTRRKFIKGLGSTALVTATASAIPQVGYSAQGGRTDWSSTYDWICVGSGFTGCAAAIAGHDKGFKTLLLEKEDMIGGLSSQSGGILWAPMNYLQKAAGIKETREEALQYMQYLSAGYALPEYMEAYVDNAARVLEYLHQKADADFRLAGGEFYPVPGISKQGRMVVCEPFPAETLGAWRDKVRLSIHPHGLYEALEGYYSPQQGKDPVLQGKAPGRHMESRLAVWKKRLGPKKFDEIMKRDEERRVGGAGLIAYMFRAIIKRGIDVRTGTRAEKLLEENGRVVGVVVNHKGKEEKIRAAKGVVLAMGGNPLFVEAGLGWRLAVGVGAAVETEAVAIVGHQQVHVPGEDYPDGSPVGRENWEVSKPHSMFVNRFGERFGDGSFFQALGSKLNHFDAMGEHHFVNIPCYLIFDQNLIEKYGFAGMPPGTLEGLEWVTQAATLDELAQEFKLPAAKLKTTVARFNEHARRREDPDFNRKPASLAPLEKPPFYGLEIDIRGKHSFLQDPFRAAIRVVINSQAQVLRETRLGTIEGLDHNYLAEKPIPGLYACGTIATSGRIYGVGYQAGYSLMGYATFGFLAAEHAATVST